jgi:hypothetical protein
MDLEKLNSINTNDPAQVKALQQFLKSRGYYTGPIDGKWGGGTTTATVKLRDELRDERKDTRATAEANAEANSPKARLTKMATEFGPWAVGVGGGIGTGLYTASKATKEDKRLGESAKRLAQNKALTPAAAQEGLRGIDQRRTARSVKQFLAPAALGAMGAFTSEVVAPRFKDDPETEKWINHAATAENAAGASLASKQLLDVALRGDPVDPEDRALIASRSGAPNVPSGGTPPPNAPPAPKPNSQRLIAAARAAGATGKLTKTSAAAYLATNVTDANRAAVAKELGVGPGQKIASAVKRLASKAGSSSILLPLAAGAYAAGEAGSEARAEGAGAGETAARSGVAGAAAGGLAAGAVAGMNKLAEVGARYAPTAMRVAGRFAGPVGVGLAAHDVVQGVNRLAHLSPPQDPGVSLMAPFMPPEGGNAMQQAGEQPDPFGAALDEFLRLAPEMQMQGGP